MRQARQATLFTINLCACFGSYGGIVWRSYWVTLKQPFTIAQPFILKTAFPRKILPVMAVDSILCTEELVVNRRISMIRTCHGLIEGTVHACNLVSF